MSTLKSSLVCLVLLVVLFGVRTSDVILKPTCLPQELFVDITTTLATFIPKTLTSYLFATHTPTFTVTNTVFTRPVLTRWRHLTLTPLPQYVTRTTYLPLTTLHEVEATFTNTFVSTSIVNVLHTREDPDSTVTVTSVSTFTKVVEVTQSPASVIRTSAGVPATSMEM